MSEEDEKQRRIVEARMNLRVRHQAKIRGSASMSDPRPMGSGTPNRHGMPKVPPGQHVTKSWPVLDLGVKPNISTARWSLTIDGAVEAPVTLDWAAFMALPQVEDVSDFHCVTTWSLMDSKWKGVSASTVIALARPRESAQYALLHASDEYTTNLELFELLKDDVLLVHTWNDQPLPRDHGGPVRLITPQLYAWKGPKWINRIELLDKNKRGFWEDRGYSDTAHPWRDDRYS
jgi:DMSO/TMAO reductase YedYZ molybdopterin-dependent catalytic subunit